MDRTIPVEEIYRTLLEMEESDWIEAKSLRRDSTRSLLETVCSFANEPHLGGGCILVGVAKDRERHDGRFWVDGVDSPDKAQADIATPAGAKHRASRPRPARSGRERSHAPLLPRPSAHPDRPLRQPHRNHQRRLVPQAGRGAWNAREPDSEPHARQRLPRHEPRRNQGNRHPSHAPPSVRGAPGPADLRVRPPRRHVHGPTASPPLSRRIRSRVASPVRGMRPRRRTEDRARLPSRNRRDRQHDLSADDRLGLHPCRRRTPEDATTRPFGSERPRHSRLLWPRPGVCGEKLRQSGNVA